jgi:hypothetical protein
MSLNELTKQISRSQIRFRVVQSCLHCTLGLDNKDKDMWYDDDVGFKLYS